jgi:ribosomal protein L15
MGLPKFKGMLPRNAKNQVVLTSTLEKNFDANAKINPGTLKDLGLIEKVAKPVKILFDKEVSKPFEVFACTISVKAKQTIEKAGGKAVNAEVEVEEKK